MCSLIAEASPPRLSVLRIITPLLLLLLLADSATVLLYRDPVLLLLGSATATAVALLLVRVPLGLLDSPVGGTRVVTPGSSLPLSFLRAAAS